MAWRYPTSKVLPLALLGLLVLSVVPLPVASLELSEEYDITDTSDSEGSPRIDVDSEGNYHIAYLYADGGDYNDLMYRKVGPTGNTLAGPLTISPSNVESGYTALAIAVDPTDRVHIAFSVQTSNDDDRDVYYAQVKMDGGIQVAARNVHSSQDQAGTLDIDGDASGNAYIVWSERSDTPEIMWIKLSSSGSVSRPADTISGDLGTGGDVNYPRIAVDTSGDSYIAWQQKDNFAVRFSIYYTHLTSSGSVDVDPVQVASNAVIDLTFLEAAGSGNSDLYLTWVQGNSVHWSIIDRDGDVNENQEVASTIIGELTGPDLAIAPNDDVYLVYMMRENLINAPWHPYVRVRFDSNNSWSDADKVDEGTASAGQGRIAAGDEEGAVVFSRSSDLYMVTVGGTAANRPPVASLSASPTDPGVDEMVTFDGSDSGDPDVDDYVDDYYFEYGDGANSGWQTSTTSIHSYSTVGTYTARLRVRDSYGEESDTADTLSIRVTSAPTNRAPTAVLRADKTSVDAGGSVRLDGDASTDPDGVVSLYNFNFGDGVTTGWVTQGAQTHTYTTAGTYTATLQVKDDDGDVSENTDAIAITVVETNEPPVATIEDIDPNPAFVGDEVTFTGKGVDSDGTIAAYSWASNLEPGDIGSAATFTLNNLATGVHTITFKVKDNDAEWSPEVTLDLEIKTNTPIKLADETTVTKAKTDEPIEFRVKYTDAENDRPTSKKLYYTQGDKYQSVDLIEVDQQDDDYSDGKEYYYTMKLDKTGDWKYYFQFENAKNSQRSTVVKTIKIEEAASFIPGMGVMAVAGSMVLMAAAVVLTERRRRSP